MPSIAERLRTLANTTLANDHTPTSTDEAGHRRPVDAPFFAWRAHRHGSPTNPVDPRTLPPPSTIDADVWLWHALSDPKLDVDKLLADLTTHDRNPVDAGALFPNLATTPIEVWTEVELASIHALTWLTHQRKRPDWAQLINRVIDWHIHNVQPDNATNHPWAIHAFLAASDAGSTHAALYADTLLHNTMVSQGRPDRLSAHILLDAADAIDINPAQT